jgi:hypothetical protein
MSLDANGNGNTKGSWTELGQLVLSELERHDDRADKIESRIADIKEKDIPRIDTEIATLKTKAMMYGAIAGTLFSGLAFALFEFLFHLLKIK